MIDLVAKRRWFFLISALVIILGVVCLAIFGLRLGVDFRSGTAMTLHFDKEVSAAQLRQQLVAYGHNEALIQSAGKGDFFVRLREISADENKALVSDLTAGLNTGVTQASLYSVSPILAKGTVRNTVIAVAAAALGILIYMVWAFRKMPNPFRWGTCAVIALCHDLLIVILIFSLLGQIIGAEIDASFVTGVLAVVGISVNNIVVVFDRIRASLRRGLDSNFEATVNAGIIESLVRSLNTGLATLFVIVALFLIGGVTIRNLVLVLLVGITTGIYSSICIAGQLLVVWNRAGWVRPVSPPLFAKKTS